MPPLRELTFPGCVFAVETVLETFRHETARLPFSETGGVLFGYRTADREIVVTEATGPGPRAKHGWSFFEPDTHYFQEQLSEVYRRSRGAITYVGDWHTHPYGSLRPSGRDSTAMLNLARSGDVRLQEPLLWIYRSGRRLLRWSVPERDAVWVLDAPDRGWWMAPVQWVTAVGCQIDCGD